MPTGAGGTFDKIARLIQRTFREKKIFPGTLVIKNLPGAGGTFGTKKIKDAKPDAYTIGLWNPGLVTSKKMGSVDYDHTAFEILGATGYVEVGFGVNSKGRYKSIQELIEKLKKKPKSVKVATNMGLPVHFIPLLFAQEAGIDFRFVQTGGGSKRLASILGQHADLAQFSVLEFETYKSAGLKPLLLLSEQRHPKIPDVPTAQRTGFKSGYCRIRYLACSQRPTAGTPEDAAQCFEKSHAGSGDSAGVQSHGHDKFFYRSSRG